MIARTLLKAWLIISVVYIIVSCDSRKEKSTTSEASKDSVNTVSDELNQDQLPIDTSAIEFADVKIEHPRGDTFSLRIPKDFKIKIVATGLMRPRFMDFDPDGNLFVTDMYNLADNSRGAIYKYEIRETYNLVNRVTYLSGLRNPNSAVFHIDKEKKLWLYVAMTDKLIRIPYAVNDSLPSGPPQQLDTYPDYGLSYRYGGWHLTRTIAFNDSSELYISVGSSCNSCIEKEEVRASLIRMNEDGNNRKIIASGLRNAVGLAWANGKLYVSNMAADHLGKDKPDDAVFEIEEGKHYGWPYFFHWNGAVYRDSKYDTVRLTMDSTQIPSAFSYLGAHTAPLGLAWFGEKESSDPVLKNYFLLAQHGSYTPSIGRGYSLQRIRRNHKPEDFITGFLDKQGKVHGRPCGIKSAGADSFYFTDDKFGTIYYVYKDDQ
ncbi:sorbosone dehydrogenase [Cytophagales bacterium WSM2-2]|nr:sorbosone dehydrogenase [Cytophagales bacterium WSM2-2]